MSRFRRSLIIIFATACVFCGTACERNPQKGKPVNAEGWIVGDDVMVGGEFELGRAYARKSESFQYELFFRNGVVTSSSDRLPSAIISAPIPSAGFSSGKPPEFALPDALYSVFAKITPETDLEAFALAFGSPTVSRPVFSVDSMSGITEYFWTLPDRYVLGIIAKDSKAFEKILIRGAIPAVWR